MTPSSSPAPASQTRAPVAGQVTLAPDDDQNLSKSHPHTIAVYGSLRKGLHNHPLLSRYEPRFVGLGTMNGLVLYSMGSYPAAVPVPSKPEACVIVEVYRVTDEGLLTLDLLEGHPRFYVRTESEALIDGAKAATPVSVYLLSKSHTQMLEAKKEKPLVHGDWVAYMVSRTGLGGRRGD